MSILKRVDELIYQRNLSRNKVELATGLSRGSIAKWDSVSPKVENIAKVAEYLDTTIDYLFSGRIIEIPSSEIVQQIFTPEEQEILDLFTAVNAEGQKAILGAVRGIVYTGLYTPKKENQAM